jgi:hypothetical protein
MTAFRVLPAVALASLVFSALAISAEPPVTGDFKVKGNPAKLAFARALKGEPFDGKPTTIIVLSEKDPSKSAKPEFDAMFGKLGNSLSVTVTDTGDIIGCQAYHVGFEYKSFSSSGVVKMEGYKNEGGIVQGKLTTGGEVEAFHEKWEVNLTFKTKAR